VTIEAKEFDQVEVPSSINEFSQVAFLEWGCGFNVFTLLFNNSQFDWPNLHQAFSLESLGVLPGSLDKHTVAHPFAVCLLLFQQYWLIVLIIKRVVTAITTWCLWKQCLCARLTLLHCLQSRNQMTFCLCVLFHIYNSRAY
jgi:hypothetical protein